MQNNSANIKTLNIFSDVIFSKNLESLKLNIESYRQVVSALASELDRLSANPSELKRLALGAYSCSKTFSWDLREEMFQQYYDIAINNWKALKN